MRKRQQFAVILGLIVSAVFVFFAFRDLHPEAVIEELGRVEIGWLLVGAATYFAAVAVITLRWRYLLNAIERLSMRVLYPLVCIGYMGNNVYPFRSGEALRIFLLNRNHNIPIVRGATTVVVERVFDGLVMLTFIVVSLLFLDVVSADVQRVASLAAPLFLIALAAFFALAARPGLLHNLIRLVSRILPQRLGGMIQGMGEDVIHGLEGLRTPGQLIGAIISSYVTWMIEASVYWMVAWAFNLDVSYALMLLVVGTVNLAGLIPASPGQIGVFEFFASAVLVAAGVGEATALSYAVTVHVVIWLPVTLAGFIFLARQGLNWQTITRARELEEGSLEKNGLTIADTATPSSLEQQREAK
ncbi:MAG: lysylphosphatidylglycerol synthase transmembrane domain-containing protein [Chloroflexota bacterium]